MSSTFQDYVNRRAERLTAGVDLEKLRLGQQACEIVNMLSDPEIRFALVPLTEGEYRQSMELAEKLELEGTNAVTHMVRERVQQEAVIFYAAREMRSLSVKFFESLNDVAQIEHMDLSYAYDVYLEMTAQISPSMLGLSEEDFQELKVLWPKIAWSELSGQQWYAAQRLLNLIQPLLLTVKSSGSQ